MRSLMMCALAVASALLSAYPASALRDPSLDEVPPSQDEGLAYLTCYVGVGYTAPRDVGCPVETTHATYFDTGLEVRRDETTGVVTNISALPGNGVCYPAARECAAGTTGWVYPDSAGNYVWEYEDDRGRHVYPHAVGTALVP